MKTFTKKELQEFVNELSFVKKRYKCVEEEPVPKGYFTARELSEKCDIAHRVSQRWISELMSQGKLNVLFARRLTNGIFVKKIPLYKFKSKKDENQFIKERRKYNE